MVRGAGGRRGAAGGWHGRGRGGRGSDHLGMGQAADGAPAVLVDGDGAPIAAEAQAGVINPISYERSHERFTWNGVLRPHADRMKRVKILPQARNRVHKVKGSCVYSSITTALEAANRMCGVEVGELAWEELHEMVDEFNPCRITAALRVLKYRGIRRTVDYKKGNLNGKRFKISQFYEFCNVDIIHDDVPACGLDQHNMKAAIKNMLSRTVLLAHFPISENYYELLNGGEHIYAYDERYPVFQRDEDENEEGSKAIATHVVVVTGFRFEESTPYFEFLDSNGKKFGKNGFGRIFT
ncbi:hypothetical protein SEVIR_2G097100v4 [Setaria viridis]|uniref:Peptidase C1A papain C-terminal domain-containing protein n=2 Tax=Setaria TaxID=4554 RepID=A0A368PX56_SETIT|nr:uncharacterized protein LOC117846298 [Setaria viridis]RCV10212.1 hypothetical protein SETIT_2G094300v2 [Setaria italica]TKW31311.1 hypothetical protein SEVIR_2G097100v2 [Setaria viridis]